MNKTKVFIVCGLLVAGFSLEAQSNAPAAPPPDALGNLNIHDIAQNIPTVPLANEIIGLSEGMLMRGGATFASATLIDYDITKTFFLRGEVDAGTASSGIEGVAAGGGIYRSWPHARVWGVMEGRREFTPSRWDGIAGAGAAYTPSTNGVLQNFSLTAETRIVVSSVGKNAAPPEQEQFAGLRYSF